MNTDTPGGTPKAAPPAGASPEATAFISYASADRAMADELTAYLEARGIRCWMAPRDVPPGALYADAIVRAINEARTLVLILSRHSTESRHVGKELERASSKRKAIIAVRLDDAALPPAFEYFLSESQWADVAAEGRERAFARLTQALLAPGSAPAAPPPAQAPEPPAREPSPPAPGSAPLGRARWIAAALVLAAVLAAGGYMSRVRGTGAPAPVTTADKSIAVLPFTDMSESRDQEFFADGMAEQILDLLAQIPSLKVIARTSSFQFKGQSADVRAVGEKLGVATVLEGSVRKAGDHLRITAQLIRAADGSHLWSQVYDAQVKDVLRTQDEIASAVVSALKVSLLGAPPVRQAGTANPEAYSLYLQSLADLRFDADSVQLATERLQRSLALDPNFAPAWALLADLYSSAMVFGVKDSYQALRERILGAANHALALDPRNIEALTAISNLYFVDYDPQQAGEALRTAREIAPQDPNVLSQAAFFAIGSCRLEEAERDARTVIEHDPLNVDSYRILATALWFQGRNREAEDAYRQLLVFRPDAETMRYRLALILVTDGRAGDALKELQDEKSERWQLIGRIMALDALGRRSEADTLLGPLTENPGTWQYQLAQIHALRHDRDGAYIWLVRARDIHDPGYINYLKCDPAMKPMRDDPRYQALVASLKLPP
ncbi:MAG: TIR domain-containing protein [Proteobacteria bacterium]|nr:TIR domain-containing protein [Pseudomonadota bacterium]